MYISELKNWFQVKFVITACRGRVGLVHRTQALVLSAGSNPGHATCAIEQGTFKHTVIAS